MKMDISGLWSLQLMMFFMVTVGAVLKKTNILKGDNKGTLTDIVLYFFLPCNIINSFRMEFDTSILKNIVLVLGIAFIIQVFCYILSKVLYNNKPLEIKRVMQYCTIISNSGFLGMPIAEGIFGPAGLMYASVFIIPNRIAMWSVGISCFTESPDFKSVVKKLATHPCIIAVYIGLILLVFQKPLAGIYNDIIMHESIISVFIYIIVTAIDKTIVSAGGCTTALTMVLIGMMMADIKFDNIFDKNVLFISAFRLVVLPAIVYLACRAFNIDSFISGLSVLISAMPAGTTSAILAAKYGCDYLFATKCIVVSTLLSMLSIPLICMLFL